MIKPAGYRVLVKADPVEAQTDWGFSLVTNERDRLLEKAAQDHGVLVAVGDQAWNGETPWASIGDRVSYSKHGGKFIKDPTTGEEYVLLNDEDITSIIIDEDN